MVMCIVKGAVDMKKTQKFMNEEGVHFLVETGKNVAFILDEEADKLIAKIQGLLAYLEAQGIINKEQQYEAQKELKEAMKDQVKELYQPDKNLVQNGLQWLKKIDTDKASEEVQEVKQFFQDFWESYEN